MRVHLYAVGLGIGLGLASPALAQPAPPAATVDDAPSADVAALNRRIAERNAAILQGNADRQAAWEKERAEVAAENARLKAAFAAQQAAHEADMAKWRADTLARSDAGRPPAAATKRLAQNDPVDRAPPRRICHMEAQTGSMIKRTRVCMTSRESDARAREAQSMMAGPRSSGCGNASCD